MEAYLAPLWENKRNVTDKEAALALLGTLNRAQSGQALVTIHEAGLRSRRT